MASDRMNDISFEGGSTNVLARVVLVRDANRFGEAIGKALAGKSDAFAAAVTTKPALAFDEFGRSLRYALLQSLRHHPANYSAVSDDLRWGAVTVQHVLDVALAWAALNKRFEVAEFLIAHGADVNTNWSTHEPASTVHDCAINGDFEGARFLIAHGIDLTIRDHRWDATAAGWAIHAAKDDAMANLLTEAEKRRGSG
jgi:ankyrin repeat protein